MSGPLYLVSTPIGNPEDMTVRAIRILKEVAIVAAEDTSRTHSLLLHYGIDTPLTSYHDVNKDEKTPVLIRRLHEGQSIALVSDDGTPLISDPGAVLVAQALASGIRVVPVPGPSAVLAALSASGLSTEAFVYQGYLPRQSTERRLVLETLRTERRTLILFESPEMVRSSLEAIHAVFGNRRIVLARELTKPNEEFLRGTVEELMVRGSSGFFPGQVTLVVEGNQQQSRKGLMERVKKPGRRRAFGS
ncbi:MAG: 16S rRNA (cytidine(1402)-2'-O)-methyltransferase [Nitrospirae bacterium]|nr:MAG: 16S rRNA (cytidine(1402)-2'-O)-methyltransferase [Nitrospirota bacterium]